MSQIDWPENMPYKLIYDYAILQAVILSFGIRVLILFKFLESISRFYDY